MLTTSCEQGQPFAYAAGQMYTCYTWTEATSSWESVFVTLNVCEARPCILQCNRPTARRLSSFHFPELKCTQVPSLSNQAKGFSNKVEDCNMNSNSEARSWQNHVRNQLYLSKKCFFYQRLPVFWSLHLHSLCPNESRTMVSFYKLICLTAISQIKK